MENNEDHVSEIPDRSCEETVSDVCDAPKMISVPEREQQKKKSVKSKINLNKDAPKIKRKYIRKKVMKVSTPGKEKSNSTVKSAENKRKLKSQSHKALLLKKSESKIVTFFGSEEQKTLQTELPEEHKMVSENEIFLEKQTANAINEIPVFEKLGNDKCIVETVEKLENLNDTMQPKKLNKKKPTSVKSKSTQKPRSKQCLRPNKVLKVMLKKEQMLNASLLTDLRNDAPVPSEAVDHNENNKNKLESFSEDSVAPKKYSRKTNKPSVKEGKQKLSSKQSSKSKKAVGTLMTAANETLNASVLKNELDDASDPQKSDEEKNKSSENNHELHSVDSLILGKFNRKVCKSEDKQKLHPKQSSKIKEALTIDEKEILNISTLAIIPNDVCESVKSHDDRNESSEEFVLRLDDDDDDGINENKDIEMFELYLDEDENNVNEADVELQLDDGEDKSYEEKLMLHSNDLLVSEKFDKESHSFENKTKKIYSKPPLKTNKGSKNAMNETERILNAQVVENVPNDVLESTKLEDKNDMNGEKLELQLGDSVVSNKVNRKTCRSENKGKRKLPSKQSLKSKKVVGTVMATKSKSKNKNKQKLHSKQLLKIEEALTIEEEGQLNVTNVPNDVNWSTKSHDDGNKSYEKFELHLDIDKNNNNEVMSELQLNNSGNEEKSNLHSNDSIVSKNLNEKTCCFKSTGNRKMPSKPSIKTKRALKNATNKTKRILNEQVLENVPSDVHEATKLDEKLSLQTDDSIISNKVSKKAYKSSKYKGKQKLSSKQSLKSKKAVGTVMAAESKSKNKKPKLHSLQIVKALTIEEEHKLNVSKLANVPNDMHESKSHDGNITNEKFELYLDIDKNNDNEAASELQLNNSKNKGNEEKFKLHSNDSIVFKKFNKKTCIFKSAGNQKIPSKRSAKTKKVLKNTANEMKRMLNAPVLEKVPNDVPESVGLYDNKNNRSEEELKLQADDLVVSKKVVKKVYKSGNKGKRELHSKQNVKSKKTLENVMIEEDKTLIASELMIEPSDEHVSTKSDGENVKSSEEKSEVHASNSFISKQLNKKIRNFENKCKQKLSSKRPLKTKKVTENVGNSLEQLMNATLSTNVPNDEPEPTKSDDDKDECNEAKLMLHSDDSVVQKKFSRAYKCNTKNKVNKKFHPKQSLKSKTAIENGLNENEGRILNASVLTNSPNEALTILKSDNSKTKNNKRKLKLLSDNSEAPKKFNRKTSKFTEVRSQQKLHLELQLKQKNILEYVISEKGKVVDVSTEQKNVSSEVPDAKLGKMTQRVDQMPVLSKTSSNDKQNKKVENLQIKSIMKYEFKTYLKDKTMIQPYVICRKLTEEEIQQYCKVSSTAKAVKTDEELELEYEEKSLEMGATDEAKVGTAECSPDGGENERLKELRADERHKLEHQENVEMEASDEAKNSATNISLKETSCVKGKGSSVKKRTFCKTCQCDIQSNHFRKHLLTQRHKRNENAMVGPEKNKDLASRSENSSSMGCRIMRTSLKPSRAPMRSSLGTKFKEFSASQSNMKEVVSEPASSMLAKNKGKEKTTIGGHFHFDIFASVSQFWPLPPSLSPVKNSSSQDEEEE